MSRYKKKNVSVINVLLKDKGFYAVLTVSLVLVVVAAYLALEWEEKPYETPPETVYVDPLPEGYVPDWPEETVSQNVLNEEKITVELPEESELSENAEETVLPEEPAELVLLCPVNDDAIVSVNDFSGTMPVFSETLNDWRVHGGIDLITDEPCDVYAAADGVVEDIYDDGFMGTSVLIRHNDDSLTLYQSLSPNVKVVKGCNVSAGDLIGKTGTTAENEALVSAHVHFEHIVDGKRVEPVFLNND